MCRDQDRSTSKESLAKAITESFTIAPPSDCYMKVISVNVGLPRLLAWQGTTFKTGIFKSAVSGAVTARATNLDGDRQADLTVHGGREKAVYAYPSEHYPAWQTELQEKDLPWGSFGENLTTEGMAEADVLIGDRYKIGSAVVKVTTPRLPCFKLAAKFKREDIIRKFVQNGRSGFYFSVVEEGEVAAGDEIALLEREAKTLSIADVNRLYTSATPDREKLKRSLDVHTLPQSWRDRFRARLEELEYRSV